MIAIIFNLSLNYILSFSVCNVTSESITCIEFYCYNQAGVMCVTDPYLTALSNLPLQEVILVIAWLFFFSIHCARN